MSEPLDVSLRVRLKYEAGGANRAIADVEKLKDKAAKLGSAAGGTALATDIAKIAAPAEKAAGKIEDLAKVAARLGTVTGGAILAGDLAKVSAPAEKARRDVLDLGAAAAKLGTVTGGAILAGDLAKVSAPAEKARRDVLDLGAAAANLGQTTGIKAVVTDLNGIAHAAQPVKRDIIDLSAAAKKFGDIELGKNHRRDFQALSRLTGGARHDIIDLRQAVDKLGSSSGPAKLEKDLDAIGRKADEAGRKLGHLGGAGRAGGRAGEGGGGGDFGREALGATGVGRFAGLSSGGVAGLAAGAGITAVAGAMAYATRDAVKFETAMAEVNKAVDDLSPEKLKELETTILRISRTNGIDKGEIAAGVAQAGYAGRPSADLPRFAEFAAMTGPAWGISVEKAGDDLSKLGNIFHFNQQQLEGLANTVDYLGNKTAAREPDIADFLKRTGGTAQVFGLGADQTAAYGATMQAAGMQPEVAATAFNAIMQKLGAADKGGKGFTSALGEMHLSARGLMREIQQDPSTALVHFFEQLNKLPKEKQLGIAKELFGLEHSDEAMILAGQVGELVKNLGLLKDAAAKTGSVENSFKVFSATTQASIARATTQLDAFATHLGQSFSPVVETAANWVAKLFGNLNDGADRAAKAVEILDKLKKGETLTPEDQGALDADPKLKDRVDQGQAWERRKAILQPETIAPAPPAPAAATPFGPPMPDDDDRAAMATRERNRRMRLEEIQELDNSIQQRAGRGFQVQGDKLKLEDLRSRFLNTFHENADDAAKSLPGTDKHAELATEARRQLTAYNGEFTTGLAQTVRIATAAGKVINEALLIRASYTGEAPINAEGGIVKASYGGAGMGGDMDRSAGRYSIRTGTAGNGPTNPAVRSANDGAMMGGSRSWRNNNPGNLRFGAFTKAQGATGADDRGFAIFPDVETGRAAQGNLLFGSDGYKGLSVGQAIAKWAPPTENDTGGYTRAITSAVGVDANTPMASLSAEQRYKFMSAQQAREGWRAGVTGNGQRSIVGGDRKGFANLMHGQYGAPGQNLTSIETPSGRRATVHAEAASSFAGFLKDLEGTGYKIDSLGGFANRGMAGNPGRVSQHAFGNAIDINPSRNPFHSSKTDMPANVSAMAAKWGLSWGGDWSERSRDPMHFEWTGAKPWLAQKGPAPTLANKPALMPFGLTGSALEKMDRMRQERAATDPAAGRFANPAAMKPREGTPAAGAAGSGAAAGGRGASAAPSNVQNFYSNHDPAETARFAQVQQNRHTRRTLAAALHDVGGPAG